MLTATVDLGRSPRLASTIGRTSYLFGLFLAAAILLLLPSAAAAKDGLSEKAQRQIAALQAAKRARDATERKVSGRLLLLLQDRRDGAATRMLPRLTTGIDVSRVGRVTLDLEAAVTVDLLARLRAAGATVRHVAARVGAIRADVPLEAVKRVAGWRDVRRVAPAAEVVPDPLAPATPERGAVARPLLPSSAAQSVVVSEGDRVHAADVARVEHRVSGIGTKVCALSDGIDLADASRSAGELPPVEVLPGQEGAGSEGTALLEIVHDLAPKADLGFATAIDGFESYAENIRGLRFEMGCDVILDDILYVAEAPFQDDAIARAVNSVTDDGALYFSAAGNEGNVFDGTSGNWEGDFRDAGRGLLKLAGRAHDFDPGPGVQLVNPLSSGSLFLPVTLWWADPLGRADDDYDLYALDAADNVVAFSDDVQDGDDDPFEALALPEPSLRLAVVRFRGANRYLQVSALGGRFQGRSGLTGFMTPGIIRGHTAAEDSLAIAAAPASTPLPFDLETGDPPNPAGPFPNPFTARQQPERFTSDGPRRVFFTPAGRPLTPGNLGSTGGVVRRTPSYTAADGVRTTVPGFERFFGTSASVAHAAAIASLVLSGNRNDDLADLRAAFNAGSLDLAPAGYDRRSGNGVLRADRILDVTGATPQPRARASGVQTLTSTDGDAFLEPGETATMALAVRNEGDTTARDVVVAPETDELGVSVTPQELSYGSIPAEETRTGEFQVTLPADYPLGRPVELRIRVRFSGDLSPTATTLRLPTGKPAATTSTFSYAGPPVPIPDDDPAGAEAPIDVSGIGYPSHITFSIDGQACTTDAGAQTVGLDHTYVADLIGTLIAPDGTAVRLFARADGSGNHLCQTVFDDAADRPFQSVTPEEAPFTGTWRPLEPLSALLAAPADGTWIFRVEDALGGDAGHIRAVSLHLAGFEAP